MSALSMCCRCTIEQMAMLCEDGTIKEPDWEEEDALTLPLIQYHVKPLWTPCSRRYRNPVLVME